MIVEQSKPAISSKGIGLAIVQLITGAFMIAQECYSGGFGAIQMTSVTVFGTAVGQIIERIYSGNKKLYVRRPRVS